jgi:cellulose synthase/poly-beta-1,6-N-acetylglucosamine synthase-like glycosyltransferase
MIFFLGFVTVIATIAQLISFQRLYAYVERELHFTPSSYLPKVSVILPCKGLDPGFRDNISKLLQQKYCLNASTTANFEVVFAVAQVNDPAYAVLTEICAAQKDVTTKIVVAGIDSRRGQKVNNQLAALKKIADDSEVIVFVDSDVIARDDFLSYLVAHLEDKTVGATTGYRFYIPFGNDWAPLIRSLWNRMTAWEMAHPGYAFAWGGAMAITRENFQRASIEECWDRSADDDLSLTKAIKDLGLQVRFVPQCLVASNGDGSFAEIIEWTNRQLILTKVYYPKLWRKAIYRAGVLTAWLISVLVSISMSLSNQNGEYVLAAAVGLLLLPVEIWFLFKAQKLWHSVLLSNFRRSDTIGDDLATAKLPYDKDYARLSKAYDDSFWKFTLALPLAHLVLPWMTLYSIITNRIKWRGIRYELKSATETITI